VTSDVTKIEALLLLEGLRVETPTRLGLAGRRSRRGAGRPPVRLRGDRAFGTRGSMLERRLNEVEKLRVLPTALVDDLVEEVPPLSHADDHSADGRTNYLVRISCDVSWD
jgi:hypothetical protein